MSPLSSVTDIFPPAILDFPGSDVTLVSSDDREFKVHRVILSLASPFFASMFSLPPAPSTSSTNSIIQMVETSSVLEMLLCYTYPTSPKPQISDIAEAVTLIETARKLELHAAEVEVTTRVEKLLALDPNPLKAWALAIRCGAEDARRAAMLRLLILSDSALTEAIDEASADLVWPSALDYYKLLKWRANAVREGQAVDTSCVSEICEKVTAFSFAQLIQTAVKQQNTFELLNGTSTLMRTCANVAKLACSCSGCRTEPLVTREVEMKNLGTRLESVRTKVEGEFQYQGLFIWP